jgi:hypothetical protein
VLSILQGGGLSWIIVSNTAMIRYNKLPPKWSGISVIYGHVMDTLMNKYLFLPFEGLTNLAITFIAELKTANPDTQQGMSRVLGYTVSNSHNQSLRKVVDCLLGIVQRNVGFLRVFVFVR